MRYIFQIVLWDETGNILLVKKDVTIKRATQRTAKEYLQKKYPLPYFIERKS
jgi:hypothetical protein